LELFKCPKGVGNQIMAIIKAHRKESHIQLKVRGGAKKNITPFKLIVQPYNTQGEETRNIRKTQGYFWVSIQSYASKGR